MKLFTKAELIEALRDIHARGWIEMAQRIDNVGGFGNMLEDLLGIAENNLPLPNAAEWELKTWKQSTQRRSAGALVTLFHLEPSPTALKFVPNILLPKYGWAHRSAGTHYPEDEMSFRQTISTRQASDRGFRVVLDDDARRVCISFEGQAIHTRHAGWRDDVARRVGLGPLDPQPYWGYDDLIYKAGSKLKNMFFVGREERRQTLDGQQRVFCRYVSCIMLSQFDPARFIDLLREGVIYVDFDARTGHNHGTKFRIPQARIIDLYTSQTPIFGP
jgi:hypothetical protein